MNSPPAHRTAKQKARMNSNEKIAFSLVAAIILAVLLITSCGLPADPQGNGRIVPAPYGYTKFCAEHPGDKLCPQNP